MNTLSIVEQEILSEVTKELLGISYRVSVDLDEFFGQGSLVTFDTTVDTWAARVAPVMGNGLRTKESIKLAFELLPIIGLHILDRHGAEALQIFEKVPGIVTIEAGIWQGECQLGSDIDGRVEITLELIQFPHHRIHLPMTFVGGVRRITHPCAWQASFSRVLSPF